MTINVGSLFESSGDNVLLSATRWIEATMLGSVATLVAVPAIAGIGFLLLQGRLAIKDGARVVLGCFIIFGAVAIAQGIAGISGQFSATQQIAKAPDNILVSIPDIPERSDDYDPYAGAAPRRAGASPIR